MQQFSSQPTLARYAAFNFAQLLRRTHIALISLVFACVAALSPDNAIAAHTSIVCPAQTGTAANGGTVTINISACDPFVGAAASGPVDGPLFPSHGAAILRIQTASPGVPFRWFLDYTHNGNSATTDAFEFTDSSGTGGGMETVRVTITITPPTSSIVVSPASLPTLTAGTAFSQTLTSTGGTAAYAYTLSTGALPIGLSLTAGGVLSGTPTQRGNYTFGVRSLDALGAFVVKGYSGSVQNPSITLSPNTFTLVQSAATSFSLATIGGVTPHSYQTEPFPGTAPAPGLTMSSAGLISGTPTALGSTTTSIRVTDASTPTASAYFELESLTLNVVAPPSVAIAVSPASVAEDGGTNLTYTVTRSANLSVPTTVNISTGGTATSGVDYAGGVATVVIPANATTATITINPNVDSTVEANETVILTVAAGTGYTVGSPPSATGTINNDDALTASIAVAPASVLEDGTANLVYTVTLSQPNPGAATTVNYSIAGTASNGTDYAAITSPLVIPTNATTGTITVNPSTDIAIENNETVLLTLAAGTGYTVAASPNNAATGTISNDDVPTASIAVAPASVLEDGTTNLIYTVTLSQPNPVAATTVNYSIAGTASNGTDYATITSPMVIPTNASSGTITVDPSADITTESDETVILTLAAGTGYTVAASPNNAASATIVADECPSNIVTNGNDSGAGSLRQIIADACAGSTITFSGGVTSVGLTSTELPISKNLTINGGAGVTVTRVVGSPNFRIFRIAAGSTVTLDSLTMSNGSENVGGVIRNQGNLTILDAVISGGSAGIDGGGIYNEGGILQVVGSTISGNTAANLGGGIVNVGFSIAANATVISSSVINNRAAFTAGVFNQSASLTMTNCTIADNEATSFDPAGDGSGFASAGVAFDTTATLVNCTFNGNRQTSVVSPSADDVYSGNFGKQSTVTLKNTILGGSASTTTPNLRAYAGGIITSQGNNLSSDSGAGLLTGPGDLTNAAPLLASLGNYGGPTQTHALLPGSPAINAGSNPALTTDQRGIARVGAVDIGAFESRGFTLTRTSGNAQTAVVNAAFAAPLVATVASANSEPVEGGVVNFTPPGAGASAAIATSPATIGAGGTASVTATANATVGSYNVLTSSNGSSGASFGLQNRLTSADLSITKTDGVTTAVPGGSVSYTITAANPGVDAVTATVADTFPAALTCSWICVGAGGGTCAAAGVGNINQGVGLPVGASVTFTASCAISAAATGSLSNTATVTSATTDLNPGNNSATDTDTLAPSADLSISKTDGVSSVLAGGNTSYTITTGNAGPSNAPGANVSDTFPASLTCTWTCVGASGGTCTAAGASNINDTVNLPAGGTVTHTANCAISALASGTIVNTASVTAPGGVTDSAPGNNSATDTNTVSLLPTLAINDVSISEGNSGISILNFTVTRTGATASAVGFNFATADGTATTADSDYVAASGNGNIPSGGASATTSVNVAINGDAKFENNESFFINLTAPTNATISDNQGVATITNDDSAPALAINDVSIVEGNSGTQNLVFTVTRTGLTALPTTFTAATANGTATAPSDYLAALVGSTSIAAGGASGTTTLTATINGDAVVEANEGFSVVLSAPANATIVTGTGIGTITNDDTAGVVLTQSLSSTDVTEGGATDSYTLYLTSQPNSNVSIGLNPGTQVTVGASPVVFTDANWNIERTVTVTAVDDAAVEGPHTGTISHLVVSPDPNYNGVTVGNVVANITDNDLPTLAINDVAIAEGNGGMQVLNFTVTRTGTTPSAVGFSFASADGTATTADSDYVTTNGIVSIPSGGASASTTVSVTINGDAVFENNESFFINLSAPTNAAIADPQGVASITNDDTAPTLAINDVSVIEGNFGTPNLVFTVTRTGLTALPATFTATTANGTATAPSDYLAALAGLTSIAAGGATGTTTLTATINSDVVVEANETFTVNLSAPGNATIAIATGTGTGTINNDDVAGVVVAQSGGSTDVTEGGATDSYTLVLTSQPTNNVSIALNPGTQVTVATSPIVFTAANWDIAQTVTVTAVDDASIEGAHTGTISHTVTSTDTNYNAFAVANVTANITDNDSPGASIVQSGGTTTAIEAGATDSYTIALTSQPSSNVTITPSGTQVSAAPASLIFTNANWNLPQTVTVTALDDNVVEGPHTGSITHVVTSTDPNYTGLSIGGVSGISITDNDSATVQFAPASVSQSEATSPMAFTVTLSNPVASGVTLSVNSAIGTATAADFTAITSGTITFPANSTAAQTVSVVTNNDALDEDDEQFSLTLSNVVATGAVTIATATATGTIQDDDALPALSIANVSVAEGNVGTSPLNFVVTLTPASGRDVSFSRATADGTATLANNDYVALATGSITIPAGQTSVMIPVLINGDTVFEGPENFSLNLSAVSNATPTSLTGTGTIAEDDQQPTMTTIVSDLPDPSVTGQSYAVTVNVAAQSTSPIGMVNVSDGLATCSITLAATTSPNSSGACNLTSTTAGAKTLNATYVPASTAFGASNATTAHQVNAAATTLSLTGPATIALNQPASYSFTLAVTAPGAGSPAGIVTVQSGAQSCTVTLPTATPNCAISFNSVGSKAISASFAPSNSDFSASNTSANINTLVFASSDLSVTKTDGVTSYGPNDLLVYTITVRNAGVDAAPQVRLVDAVPASLDNVAWTCVGSGGAICPAAGGVGSISQLYPSLPANSQLVYTLSGGVNGSPVSIVNTATVQLPSDGTVVATTPANLSATDTNLLDFIFRNGFEDATINAENGSFTFPSASLRGALDNTAVAIFSLQDQSGEVLRVYARVLDGELQYALATRSKLKVWRLSNWQTPNSEPTLSWRATRTADGFVFESAELR